MAYASSPSRLIFELDNVRWNVPLSRFDQFGRTVFFSFFFIQEQFLSLILLDFDFRRPVHSYGLGCFISSQRSGRSRGS